MKICPYCAELIQDAAIVCRYCGRELVDDVDVVAEERKEDLEAFEAAARKPKPKNAFVYGLIFGFIGAMGTYYYRTNLFNMGVYNSFSDYSSDVVLGTISGFVAWTLIGAALVWLGRKARDDEGVRIILSMGMMLLGIIITLWWLQNN